ncbi:MAG: phosphotransferase [Lachnospiraceae bacterium]|nr:phosphotransferase [Lachnospiraceae bacterium]
MLKLKYLFENYSLARKCIELYEYDKESVETMLPHYRISSNAIYPFRSGKDVDKICFLRLSPAEEKIFSDVLAEIQLIEWLNKRGFPAMRPVPMKNGKTAGQIDTEWGVFNVSCFERVSGKSLEDTKGTLQIVRGYGETLGKLHALMKEYPYSERHRNHKSLLEEISNRMSEYGVPEMFKTEYLSLCEALEQLTLTSDNYGVIHYDFEPDNVFYDVDEDAFSVIDFDDAIGCWYALDVVRAMDALEDVVETNVIKEAERCFLEEYRNFTTFTDEQMESLPLMRRFVRMQEYTTLLHVMSEPVEEMPDWMRKLIGKLKYRLSVLEDACTSEG